MRIFGRMYRWFFDNLQLNHLTLDLDSTVMTRYGEQEGAARGYNPRKPGRHSHHPLMAFIADARMIANLWLPLATAIAPIMHWLFWTTRWASWVASG
jgi:hypothetical protein